jgi:hypothetical protein
LKRRICSFDIAAVPDEPYIVTDDAGEVYLCNARCLCLWAMTQATRPSLSEELKTKTLKLSTPTLEEFEFENIFGLAHWAAKKALEMASKTLDQIR